MKGSAAGASALGMEKSNEGRWRATAESRALRVSTSASGAVGGRREEWRSMGDSLGDEKMRMRPGSEPADGIGDGPYDK